MRISSSQVVFMVNDLPVNTGDTRDKGLVPGSGRSPGGEHGNPLQCSCLRNPMDRGAWRTTVHGVAESQTYQETEQAHTHVCLRVSLENLVKG